MSPTDYRQPRCKHGWVDQGQCEQCRDIGDLFARAEKAESDLSAARKEIRRLDALLNTPELHDFAAAVTLEAAHQRQRWASDHDAGKAPEDWFWLLGYLGGKAVHAAKTGDRDKALHHTISSAAALANWHAALLGSDSSMRPGIDPAERGIAS